jgi:hypothetical protein
MMPKRFNGSSRWFKRGASRASETSRQDRLVVWLGADHLRLLWLRGNQVAGATWKPIQSGWLRNNELLEPRYLSQALGKALQEINYQGPGDLIWLLPPELMSLRVGEAPSLEGEQLQKALTLEAERIPPDRSEETVLRIGLQLSTGDRQQAVLGKVFKPTVALLSKITEEHRLRLWDIDQAGLALCIRQAAQQPEAEGLWMMLHLEPGNSSLAFFWNQELVRSRTLVDLLDPWKEQIASEADLVEALTGSASRLESNKVMDRITQAMEETLARIADDGISVDLTKAARDQSLSQLYLTGLGALESELFEHLSESYSYLFKLKRLEAPVENGALYGPLLAVLDGQRVSRFTVAGPKQDWKRLRPVLAGSLILTGVLVLGAFFYNLSLSAQINSEQARVDALRPEEERQRALRASLEALQPRIRALEALQPVDWQTELRPLLESLPWDTAGLGVGLRRISVENSQDEYHYSLEGLAASRQALEDFLREWEGRPGRSITLTRWAAKEGRYEFVASIRAMRRGVQ